MPRSTRRGYTVPCVPKGIPLHVNRRDDATTSLRNCPGALITSTSRSIAVPADVYTFVPLDCVHRLARARLIGEMYDAS